MPARGLSGLDLQAVVYYLVSSARLDLQGRLLYDLEVERGGIDSFLRKDSQESSKHVVRSA